LFGYLGLLVGLVVVLGVIIRVTGVQWPYVAVCLYSVTVVTLLAPVGFAISLADDWAPVNLAGESVEYLTEYCSCGWPFIIVCAVVLAVEILFLAIPVRAAGTRPVRRRTVWSTAIGAGAMFAILLTLSVLCVAAAIWGDDMLEIGFWCGLGSLAVNWIVWSVVFRRFALGADPRDSLQRMVRWLLRGSVVELLVAVPTHVIVRQKDECCAPGVTALGIASGLSIMLLAFGPGIYYLFLERVRRKRTGRQPVSDPEPNSQVV